MGMLEAVAVEEIEARGSIKDGDVRRLRAAYYADVAISEREADSLLALDKACPVQDPAWVDFLREAIGDYLVGQVEPRGYLTAENAAWLVARIAPESHIASRAHLELLLHVIEKARWAPESLTRLALDQVADAVLKGEGPLRSGARLEPGRIGEGEVELLRRILYAVASEDGIAISRPEAEVLLRLNEATRGADNHPSWSDLFVKALANAVMAASGYRVPSRQEALRRDRWLSERGDLSIARVTASLLSGGLGGILSAYRRQTPEECAISRLERQRIEIVTAEAVTECEATWLAAEIGKDGHLDDNERALLRFLAAESPVLHPALEPLLARAQVAA
jgi:hypothetical protein